jgi:hypothetical protein
MTTIKRSAAIAMMIISTAAIPAAPALAGKTASGPGIRTSNEYGDYSNVEFVGNCGPAKVEVGRSKTISSPNICRRPWAVTGHTPGIRSEPREGEAVDVPTISFVGENTPPQLVVSYRLRIRYAGLATTRYLNIFIKHKNGIYIGQFEMPDAFVNFCINKGKEINSYGGELYCRTEAFSKNSLSLTRRPHFAIRG